MYDVQQKGIAGAPKRVKVGVIQMGLSVFDENSIPVKNIIFQTMEDWAPDKKERGVTIGMKPKGTIYLKTPDCATICQEMTTNKEVLDAAAAVRTESSAAPESAAEEGVPPAADASPEVRPPTADEQGI